MGVAQVGELLEALADVIDDAPAAAADVARKLARMFQSPTERAAAGARGAAFRDQARMPRKAPR